MKQNIQNKIIGAAFRLASAHDWSSLNLEQIAKAAKVPAAQAAKIFSTKDALLGAMVAHIDGEVTKSIGKPLKNGSPRDRLFEVMMARFDLLQKHRKAILGIIASVKRDPSQTRVMIPAEAKAMQHMLALSGLRQSGLRDLLATGGLLALYAATLCAWERDETADMARTMAALDKHLRRVDRLLEMLGTVLKRV